MAVLNLKPVAASKPPRPTKAAIAYLKSDPTRAPEFDAKYGAGAAALHLNQTVDLTEMMAELLEQQAELIAKIEELIAVVRAPKQTILDQDGNIVGSVAMPNVRLNEDTNQIECTKCERPQTACVCDGRAGGGDLLRA